MNLRWRCTLGKKPAVALGLKKIPAGSEAPLCLLTFKKLNLDVRYGNAEPWRAPIGSLGIHECNNAGEIFWIGYFPTILGPVACRDPEVSACYCSQWQKIASIPSASYEGHGHQEGNKHAFHAVDRTDYYIDYQP